MSRAGAHIVLVVPPDHIDEARTLASNVLLEIVAGGPTRQDSVANGLRAVSTDLVLVHDAARPFVEVKLIEELLNVLDGADGVIPVVPVGETLKELEGVDVVRTLDRTRHWLAQTPQLFRTESPGPRTTRRGSMSSWAPTTLS